MKEQLIILDGGMGTDLQHSGLKPGENPAVYGMTHAAEIRNISRGAQTASIPIPSVPAATS